MDSRAFRIAQQFVRAHVRRARYAPEFLEWADSRRFPNPNTEGRLKDIKFQSLPDDEQQKIYLQWRGQQQDTAADPKAQQKAIDQNVDLARHGRVVNQKPLFPGGRGMDGPANQSFLVQLEKDGQTQTFIRKPAEGEEPNLRHGIPAGQYHAREQAAYTLDSLIGGTGIVPITQTRGKEDGSYQMWADGAKSMKGKDLDELVTKVPIKKLAENPSFERLNVLDLLLGHQDRHRGNLLYTFDGEENPKNLRFIAIDNGLSMASPSEDSSHQFYVNPFTSWYVEPPNASEKEKKDLLNKGGMEGDRAVAESLSNISPELHHQIKGVKMADIARALTDAGIDDEGAVKATLARFAALQEDPAIFKKLMEQTPYVDEAWGEFQHLSGTGDLLDRANATHRKKEIDDAVAAVKPQSGWKKPMSLAEANKGMQDAENDWSDVNDPDAVTRRASIQRIAARWLLAQSKGRTLIVSMLDPSSHKPEVVGEFTLVGNHVKETYHDARFRQDIQRGIRLPGKTLRPKDGPEFMAAVQKVYGSRSLYNVERI